MTEDEWKDLQKPEKLDPELAVYVEAGGHLGAILRSPLVYSIPYFPIFNRMLNKQFHHKKEAIQDALKVKDFHNFIWLHERPYRIPAFYSISSLMDDDAYWELLGHIWVDTEHPNQPSNKRFVRELLLSKRSDHIKMMDIDEQIYLNDLPSIIDIYRGINNIKDKHGFSWTLDQSKAKWFAGRFAKDKKGMVLSGHARKSDVIAYLNGRNEKEILINPKVVTDIKIITVIN